MQNQLLALSFFNDLEQERLFRPTKNGSWNILCIKSIIIIIIKDVYKVVYSLSYIVHGKVIYEPLKPEIYID